MEIFDEKTAYDIDNAVNNNKFYKSAIYTTENGIFIGFINRDNNSTHIKKFYKNSMSEI